MSIDSMTFENVIVIVATFVLFVLQTTIAQNDLLDAFGTLDSKSIGFDMNFMQPLTQPLNDVTKVILKKRLNSFSWLNNLQENQKEYDAFEVEEGDVAVKKEKAAKADLIAKTWENGIIYYTFHPTVTTYMMDLINLAMKEWEDHTCLQFRLRQSVNEMFFLRFRSDHPGCFSFIGRQLKDAFVGQDVNFGHGCDNLHTMIHEIGHAIGLSHEQARSDRDNYISINTQNINAIMISQFAKSKTLNEIGEYDYKSVMQYPSWGFSIKPFSKITMTTKNPMFQYLLDEERQGLSFRDIKVVNIIYDCQLKCLEGRKNKKHSSSTVKQPHDPTMTKSFIPATTTPSVLHVESDSSDNMRHKGVLNPSVPSKASLENIQNEYCKNGGFMIPYKTEDKSKCVCMCPNAFTGNQCEFSVLKADKPVFGLKYYGGLRCGGNITEETMKGHKNMTIFTPGYPVRKIEYPGCSWWIRAPVNKKVKLTFSDFSFHNPSLIGSDLRCKEEKVEIRNKDLNDPVIFCGEQVKGQALYSFAQDFVVVIVADISGDVLHGRGLFARVEFVDGNLYSFNNKMVIDHDEERGKEIATLTSAKNASASSSLNSNHRMTGGLGSLIHNFIRV